MPLGIGIGIALVLATPALAWDAVARNSFADAMAAMIASEEVCGLGYDQAAIEALIAGTVPADDLEFVVALDRKIWVALQRVETMSESARTAHCAQIRRSAARHGLIAR
jgi:hypothetical protein